MKTVDFPFDEVEARLVLERVKSFISEREFRVVVGWMDGKTQAEVSAELRISANVVRKLECRVHRVIQMLFSEKTELKSWRVFPSLREKPEKIGLKGLRSSLRRIPHYKEVFDCDLQRWVCKFQGYLPG